MKRKYEEMMMKMSFVQLSLNPKTYLESSRYGSKSSNQRIWEQRMFDTWIRDNQYPSYCDLICAMLQNPALCALEIKVFYKIVHVVASGDLRKCKAS